METYELYAYITKLDNKVWAWGIGQEFELDDGSTKFEPLAGGEEETKDEASHRISEEIKFLF